MNKPYPTFLTRKRMKQLESINENIKEQLEGFNHDQQLYPQGRRIKPVIYDDGFNESLGFHWSE